MEQGLAYNFQSSLKLRLNNLVHAMLVQNMRQLDAFYARDNMEHRIDRTYTIG